MMTTHYKGAVARIYPDKAQTAMLEHLFWCLRSLYNASLLFLIETKQKDPDKTLTTEDCIRHLGQTFFKDGANPEILQLPKTFLRETVEQSLRRFALDQAKGRKSHLKSHYDSHEAIHLKALGWYGRIDSTKRLFSCTKLGQVRLRGLIRKVTDGFSFVLQKDGVSHFYLSLLSRAPLCPLPYPGKKPVGIDLGLTDYVTTSEGKKIPNPRPFKQAEKRLAHLERLLAKKTFHSKNWYKMKAKISKLFQKITHIRRDFLHKLTHRLVKKHSFIAIENLDVKEMAAKRQLAKSIADAAFFEFKRQLTYKSLWNRRTLVEVDRYYPSSQICSTCQYQEKEVKNLAVRHWTCPKCHTHHDRDLNAANNILREGIRLFCEKENKTIPKKYQI